MENSLIQSFDINAYISEYVTHKLFDVALIGLKNAVGRINKNRQRIKIEKFSSDDCIDYIALHLRENIRWATNISFRDSNKAKNINDIFIELDLFIKPLKLRIEQEEKIPEIPISNILSDSDNNIVLLGQPGAGKTTSVKKLFLELLNREHEVYRVFNFPLIIRLKDLKRSPETMGLILLKEVLNAIGVFYTFEGSVEKIYQEKILIHVFKDFIERLDLLLILDGFDEISDKELRKEIISNLRLITNSMITSRFILTCRSADYDLHIDNSNEYEICPLKEYQIESFISKWINDETKGGELLTQLKNSPYWDTTMRPLTLAHLCALYERNNSIPDRPKSIYKKIIFLLLEDWSNQRSIKRVSKYSKFDVDRKIEFLSRFAYELTIEYSSLSFEERLLQSIYKSIYSDFELPEDECLTVVKEIESHNGLIIQTGTDTYEFAHKSLLEYLVADYLVRLPIIIDDIEILNSIPNELAILISISANPSLSYYEIISNKMSEGAVSESFLKPFLSRLLTEKPDFQPSALFGLTKILLTNLISKKIHYLKKEQNKKYDRDDDYEAESIQESINYFRDCLKTVVSYKNNKVFRSSLKKIYSFYNVGTVDIIDNTPRGELNKFGKTFYLKKSKSKIKSQSVNVDLPDNLILIEDFKA